MAILADQPARPANDYTVEETLYRRVLGGMEDFRATANPVHLQDAHRALGTWLHFVQLTNADFDAGRR